MVVDDGDHHDGDDEKGSLAIAPMLRPVKTTLVQEVTAAGTGYKGNIWRF